ncbi:hypothetical protein AXG93_496s1070 [Marchantia polymorpha subsp. ruderalis]|uniref:Uncharacterized protein n=1 Tax=Marchantia polymorpha subsp. ruderalis TaxID=1480154 RepID=A0A176VR84_MARPO|nr:hypothetical protein AXG93_496s1070 [Marchantia polymorpha subsp. ruderalis]
MVKSVPLRMVPLRVPQIGLRAFQNELTTVKLDILLWGWNWVCPTMVREWLRKKDRNSRGYRPHPERWQVSDWEQVLGRCAGSEGDLLFDSESVQLSKEEELTFDGLFKNRRSRKNGYKIRDYVDRKRRNFAVAILQILQPHMTSYMSYWQVGFVELALAGTPIHWARILWKATRQHAGEEKGGSINHLSPFLINFYRSMGCLTAEEKKQFPLLSRMNPRKFVREVEVDTDLDEVPAITPPAELRIEEEHRGAQTLRKRKLGEEEEVPSEEAPSALRPSAHIPTAKGRDAETRVPSAEGATKLPSAEPEWEDLAAPTGVGSPTPLEMLAGHGVEAAAEESMRPSTRESPRILAATEILESEDDTPSEEEEVQSVRGTPIGVLCEQVVPLLRYLDRKVAKYGKPRQGVSYVVLVRHRTRIKVAANPELIAQDQKYRNLKERYNFVQDQWALARKLQKAALKL